MRLPPFGLFLFAGVCCSVMAIALHQFPAFGRAVEQPVQEPSAVVSGTSLPRALSGDAVTENSPVPADPEPAALLEIETGQAAPELSFEPLDETLGDLAPAEAEAPDPVVAEPERRDRSRSLPSGVVRHIELVPYEDKEAGLLDLLNDARLQDGQTALRRTPELDAVALARARNLVNEGYFDHFGPDGTSAFSELAARGINYWLAGENLARNNYPPGRTVEAAFQGLIASPGHRANILEPAFDEVGVAVIRSGTMWYYVMVFMDRG